MPCRSSLLSALRNGPGSGRAASAASVRSYGLRPVVCCTAVRRLAAPCHHQHPSHTARYITSPGSGAILLHLTMLTCAQFRMSSHVAKEVDGQKFVGSGRCSSAKLLSMMEGEHHLAPSGSGRVCGTHAYRHAIASAPEVTIKEIASAPRGSVRCLRQLRRRRSSRSPPAKGRPCPMQRREAQTP